MQPLIAVNRANMGSTQVQTVNARELHAFLEVSDPFTQWISRRIAKYGFEEGKDFCLFFSKIP